MFKQKWMLQSIHETRRIVSKCEEGSSESVKREDRDSDEEDLHKDAIDSSIIFFRVPSPVFPLHPLTSRFVMSPLTSRFVMSSHPRM